MTELVEVVPESVKVALAALAALCAMLGAGSLLAALRARRLGRQRRTLLDEVGVLQSALLPPVPDRLGAVRASVAYRPADGPGAGGDFYDALPLPGDRSAFILGDVSGHGHAALERTAFVRYTLRAYLEAGLAPRLALQVAGRVIGERLGGDFVTVLAAVHDPAIGSLTFASAGHPPPIVAGTQPFEPVLAASSPPIGVGARTGLRQTTLPLPAGAVACLFTDGLSEARTERGLLGRGRLGDLVDELGPRASAGDLLKRVTAEATAIKDDMAACLITPASEITACGFRVEELEVSGAELDGPLPGRFLRECGVPAADAAGALATAELLDRALLRVALGNRRTVEVVPANVEPFEAARVGVAS